jgi:hypothetical protein
MVEMYQEGATWQKVLDKVLPPRKRADFKAEKAEKEAEKARAKEENKEWLVSSAMRCQMFSSQ